MTHRSSTSAWLLSDAASASGARLAVYRGVVKKNAWLHHRLAALNLRRLLVLGLTWTDGTWAVA